MPKECPNYPLELPAKALSESTSTALAIPEGLSLDQWVAMGRELYRRSQIGTWWLADWAAHGERKYGNLKAFCEANDINYGTLKNIASVAAAVEKSRRRDLLSFTHHVEVAGLSARDQEKWLARAEKEKWPVVEMRRRIRESTMIHAPESRHGPGDEGVELQKLFLDASVVFERKSRFVKENPEEVWDYAAPFVRKVAEMFPERLKVLSMDEKGRA